jgi:SAM-dependent methyltransferase
MEDRVGTRPAAVVAELANDLAGTISKRYRIDREHAYQVIADLWARDHDLQTQATQLPDAQRLKRTRAFKQAADRARSTIYYQLRRYLPDDGRLSTATSDLREGADRGARLDDADVELARATIVQTHVSTRERLPDADAFFTALFALPCDTRSILDIGCGVHPLLYPFEGEGHATSAYVGLDRDPKVIAAVTAWAGHLAPGRLKAQVWSLADGFDNIQGPSDGSGQFDLALALKFVPVVARQERDCLALLRNIPARRLLVTGAREAMVRRAPIAHREEQVLRTFAEDNGFVVRTTLQTPSETGFLLERA